MSYLIKKNKNQASLDDFFFGLVSFVDFKFNGIFFFNNWFFSPVFSLIYLPILN